MTSPRLVPAGATAANTVVAYEPVWAIGTGKTPTAADVAEVHAHIRKTNQRYETIADAQTAEVAFVVQDSWQNRGLGTSLFGELLRAAGMNGIERFRAWVLADNRRMLDLITRFGTIEQQRMEQSVVEVTFTAAPAVRVR